MGFLGYLFVRNLAGRRGDPSFNMLGWVGVLEKYAVTGRGEAF